MKNVITFTILGASMFLGFGALASPAQQEGDREENICKEQAIDAFGDAWWRHWPSINACVAKLKQRPDDTLIRNAASTVQLNPTSVTPQSSSSFLTAEQKCKAMGWPEHLAGFDMCVIKVNGRQNDVPVLPENWRPRPSVTLASRLEVDNFAAKCTYSDGYNLLIAANSLCPISEESTDVAEHEKAGGFPNQYELAIRLSEGTEMDRQPELAIRHLEAIVKGTRNAKLKSDAEARLVELKLLLPYGGLPARLRANFPYFEEAYALYDSKSGPKALVTTLKHPFQPIMGWTIEGASGQLETAETNALKLCLSYNMGRCATVARNYDYVFSNSLHEIALETCKAKTERQRKICADKQVQKNLAAIKDGFLKKQKQAQRAVRGPSGLGKALKYVLGTAGDVMLMGLSSGAFASAYAPRATPSPAQSFVKGAQAGRVALNMPASPTLDMLERSFSQMTPVTSLGSTSPIKTGGFGFIKAQVPLSSGYTSCVYSDGSTDVVYRANCSYTTSASSFRKEKVLGLSGVPTLVHQETFLGSIGRLCVYSDGSSVRDSDGLCQRRRIGF